MKTENIDNFEQCIKCTICTVYCPVVPVNPAYPGPKQAGPDGERLRIKNNYFFDEALKYCLNCKRCDVACPSGVRISDMIQEARINFSRKKPKLRDMMLASTDFMGTMATPFAPVVNAVLPLKPVKAVLDGVMGIDHRRQFPKYTGTKFETWFRKEAADRQAGFKRHIAYFHGCYVNYNFPKLGKDLVKIMNAVGYGVQLLDKEKCCGVAKIANGLYDQAKKHGNININSIRKAKEEGRVTLGTSSTCCFTIRDEYEHVLGMESADMRESMTLATRFLYQLLDEGKIKLAFRSDYKKRVAYHSACHMERMGWVFYSTELLKMIPGVDFTMLDSQCCGIAGTYGFKRENYETSQAIGSGLFKQIKEVAPDCVATDCETCKWQIEMSTGVPVENPISIIADALDVEATIKLNS